jgi:hypothetical protein
MIARRTVLVFVLPVVFAASTSAAVTPTTWSSKDMSAAMRTLGYPKPHALKLTCRGHVAFRCVALYRHHRHRVFYALGQATGGWICAGKSVLACGVLQHGFVPTHVFAANGGGQGSAEFAAVGYIEIKYGVSNPVATHPCASTSALKWSCDYAIATVTISFKKTRAGYILSASAGPSTP